MTIEEFSSTFDVLYNNITSNQAPGLNEYEKSVFLTKAQSQLVNEYFNRRTDGIGGGFDGSQRRQYDFSRLILTTQLNPYTPVPPSTYNSTDRRSVLYLFPKDYYLSVNELLSDASYQYTVIPLSYDEYSRLMMKPYNFPVKRAVWRLFTGTTQIEETEGQETTTYTVTVAEIIGKPTMENGGPKSDLSGIIYTLRYVKKPNPIILEDLSNYGEDLTIDGEKQVSTSELPEECHQEILERAVTLAKIAWQGGTATQAAAQQRRDND